MRLIRPLIANAVHRPWVHGLLVLFMLLAQQGGWRHGLVHATHGSGAVSIRRALAHAGSAQTGSAKKADQGASLCADCLAYAATADAVSHGQPALLLAEAMQAVRPVLGHAPWVSEVNAGYRSRAPPRPA